MNEIMTSGNGEGISLKGLLLQLEEYGFVDGGNESFLEVEEISKLKDSMLEEYDSINEVYLDDWLIKEDEGLVYQVDGSEEEKDILAELKHQLQLKITELIKSRKPDLMSKQDVLKPIADKVNEFLDNKDNKIAELHTYTHEESVDVEDQMGRNLRDTIYNNFYLYKDTERFKYQLVGKKSTDPVSESLPLLKAIDWLSDKINIRYNDKDNPIYINYNTVNAGYLSKQIKGEISKGRQVNLTEESAESETGELPEGVLKGIQVHADQLHKHSGHNDLKYRLTEKEKKEKSQKLINKTAQENEYIKSLQGIYKQTGLKYGFDMKEYTIEQRKHIQNEWLDKFIEDKENGIHTYSPKQRLYLLRKEYNALGDRLRVLSEMLSEERKKRNFNDFLQPTEDDEKGMDKIDLSKREHVAALLKIDYDSDENRNNSEYIPLLISLDNKYRYSSTTHTYELLKSFRKALTHTDFKPFERDIIDLILNENALYSIFEEGIKTDPMKKLAKYINEKYGRKTSLAAYKKMVHENLATKIAKTHKYMQEGVTFKGCSKCGKSKMAVKEVFGSDSRSKDGFKSQCKQCETQSKRNAV